VKFPLELCNNLAYEHGDGTPRYFFKLDLDEVAPGRVATLPIYWRLNISHPILKEIYYADVGGFRIEKGNLQTLTNAVLDAINALVDHKTLPYYSITLPNNSRIPVFLTGEKLKLEDGGIKISGETIGEIYQKLTRQLLSTKVIKSKNDLRVSIFLWADFKLYPPAFIFRDIRERVWFPIFLQEKSGTAVLNFDLISRPSKFFKIEELASLRKEVSSYLMASRLIPSPHSLFLDMVMDDVWKELHGRIVKDDFLLRYETSGQKHEISVYKIGNELLAANRPRVYFGQDREQLRNSVAESLKEEGLVQSTTSVVIEKRRRP
jgi:hypothetical protein